MRQLMNWNPNSSKPKQWKLPKLRMINGMMFKDSLEASWDEALAKYRKRLGQFYVFHEIAFF
jgi:hypothetical protein